ncbi:glutathione S-transferase N-terminal domain-containing protein [Methylobacterium sp. NEAU 140]|uniref:glutathione S-transferase family protein n=1 Tax=Methylobacterium sp. NEAU 140 TaxID=3064945 RepID=UPI0027329D2F|nr:glutathione S-transferase N-terminal domain-containing protein [Methylobacterium sp. NEAU 140]MDP4023909.1 glutathione S-transferase N-terminal domain-containing protein [Methylobacterium sp. NEAU 140]
MTVRTLYYAPGACSLAAHIVLEESGLAYEGHKLDLAAGDQRAPEFLAVNERGRVPALVEDGWTLTECAAILRHVARQVPEKGLWPADLREQALADEWLGWLACNHHVAYAHIRRPGRYTADEDALPGLRAKGADTYGDLCTMTEVRLSNGGWAVGERYGVVDAYLMVFYVWASRPDMGMDVAARFPAWTAHARRVAERPAVQAIFVREGLPLPR